MAGASLMWTRHGHHISGTVLDVDDPNRPVFQRCGGPSRCRVCDADLVAARGTSQGFQQEQLPTFIDQDKGMTPQERAKRVVATYINQNRSWSEAGRIPPATIKDLVLTSWSMVYESWTATIMSFVDTNMHYKVTYNEHTRIAHLDVSRKIDSVEVPMYAPNRPPGEEGS